MGKISMILLIFIIGIGSGIVGYNYYDYTHVEVDTETENITITNTFCTVNSPEGERQLKLCTSYETCAPYAAVGSEFCYIKI